MGYIDQIIAILGPPQSAGEKDRLARLAEETGKSLEDIYVERVPQLVQDLTGRAADESSILDRIFSDILASSVIVRDADPTYFEKKGHKYPAVMFSYTDIVDAKAAVQAELLAEVFRTEAAKSELARQLALQFRVEAVEVFVTYG